MWAWGLNSYGQFGDGTTTNRASPVQVPGLSGIKGVVAGGYHSLALKGDGTAAAWGYNATGALGDGTTTNRQSPVAVVGSGGTGTLGNISQLAGGYVHSLALKSDGTVWGWGYNASGQVGDNTTTQRTSPVQVSGLSGVQAVTAGGLHSLALKTDSSVWGWGSDVYGQLGDNPFDGDQPGWQLTPISAGGLSGIGSLSAGYQHSLASVGSRLATTAYSYDHLYRLAGVTAPSGTTSYSYDPTGNRLSKVLNSSATTSYTYDKTDRILTAGSTSYTVNNAGNLTARGSDSFSYDQANRLTTATTSTGSGSYVYDGDGKRSSKTVVSTVTNYVYDVSGGLPVVLDDGVRKYVWGTGGLAYTVDKNTPAVQIYHSDGLGSVRAISDSTGSVVQTYQTDEFGVPTTTQGSNMQPFGFTGEQRDAEIGLVYLRARMYDPSIGRFFQRDGADSVRCDPGQPVKLDRYTYVEDNPTTRRDPSGFKSLVLGPGAPLGPNSPIAAGPPPPIALRCADAIRNCHACCDSILDPTAVRACHFVCVKCFRTCQRGGQCSDFDFVCWVDPLEVRSPNSTLPVSIPLPEIPVPTFPFPFVRIG